MCCYTKLHDPEADILVTEMEKKLLNIELSVQQE